MDAFRTRALELHSRYVWDFDRVKREAQATWNKELSKIAVTTLDEGEMVNFYTALYHALLTPTVYMDVDGQYKGLDQNVHKAVRLIDTAKTVRSPGKQPVRPRRASSPPRSRRRACRC